MSTLAFDSILIENYKSLEKVDLRLGRGLTVLIGPNNAGKSNILDAFALLGELFRSEQGALDRRGGFEGLVFRGETHRKIRFVIRGRDGRNPFSYSIGLAGSGEWRLVEEHFVLNKGSDAVSLVTREQDTVTINSLGGQQILSMGTFRDRQGLSWVSQSDERPPSILKRFISELSMWYRFELLPSAMRSSVDIRKNLLLASDGSNVATVLHELAGGHRGQFREIEDALRTLVPEIDSLHASTGEPGKTYVEIKEGKLYIPARRMSDGTLKFIGLLCMVYSPGSPGLMCLEEPENHLHPHALKLAIDVLRAANPRSQLLLTTHSPVLLDQLKLSELRAVEKRKDTTHLNQVRLKSELARLLESMGLGEAWFAGHLGGVRE